MPEAKAVDRGATAFERRHAERKQPRLFCLLAQPCRQLASRRAQRSISRCAHCPNGNHPFHQAERHSTIASQASGDHPPTKSKIV